MPPAIKFACPNCQRICKVPAELAGKQGRCPGCRKGLEVPFASTLPPSERHPAQPTVPEAPKPAPRAPAPRRCAACQAEAPLDATACPGCGQPLPAPRPPATVIAALTLFLCAPIVGIVLALLGLRETRRRGASERLAWLAIALNVVNLLLFLNHQVGRLLGR